MFESRGRAGLPTRVIVPAPNVAMGSENRVATANRPEFPAAISIERPGPPSANRKQPRSISRVLRSIRGEFGWWDLVSKCGANNGWIRYSSRSAD